MDVPRIAALLAPFLGDAPLSAVQLAQLSTYLDLLLRWNARINLTAVRDPEQIVTRHFGESLFTARRLYPLRSKSDPGSWEPEAENSWRPATGDWLLDIGSGAGFPGLPVKIWAPAMPVILLEPKYRKAIFMREAVRALALYDVEVYAARVEEFDWSAAQKSMRSPLAATAERKFATPGRAPSSSELAGPGAPAGVVPALPQNNVPRAPSPAAADPIVNRQSAIVNSLTVTLRAVEHFEKVLPVAARLLASAPVVRRRLALLIGAAQVAGARELLPGFSWSDPIAIPLSTNRVLLVETMQPRSGIIG